MEGQNLQFFDQDVIDFTDPFCKPCELPKNKYGNSTLHIASQNGHLPTCQMIMERLEDKNPKNIYGVTPLHAAAANGHLNICQFIMEQVEDKNPQDFSGMTPLHYAAKAGMCHSTVGKNFHFWHIKIKF